MAAIPAADRADLPDPDEATARRDPPDLDTRISQAELQLLAREQRVRDGVQALGRTVSDGLAPRALLLKLGGVALAGAGLVWLLRRPGGPVPAALASAPPAGAAAPGGVPHLLISLLPMAWPLLPSRWRTLIRPTTAATLLSVAVPLVQRLLRPQRRAAAVVDERAGVPADIPDAPPAVAHLDLRRYAGTWHEQARLPAPFERACDGQPYAVYTPAGGLLRVHNACPGDDGRLHTADGVARVVPGSGGARLQVTFLPPWLRWLPFDIGWADLWVLHVDETAPDYRVAIAGHPTRRGLWLLARTPRLPDAELQRLIAIASDLGYDTSRLVLARPTDTLH